MPENNTLIMLGLGAAALFLWNNRGASQDAQTDQLTGAAMMAAGEGTSPDAPFQAYSAPANPVFFFNQGGEMAQIPGTNVPRGASSDEDIGVYPGGKNQPEPVTYLQAIPYSLDLQMLTLPLQRSGINKHRSQKLISCRC